MLCKDLLIGREVSLLKHEFQVYYFLFYLIWCDNCSNDSQFVLLDKGKKRSCYRCCVIEVYYNYIINIKSAVKGSRCFCVAATLWKCIIGVNYANSREKALLETRRSPWSYTTTPLLTVTPHLIPRSNAMLARALSHGRYTALLKATWTVTFNWGFCSLK